MSSLFSNFFLCFLIIYQFTLFSDETCSTLASLKTKGKLVIGVYDDDPYFSCLNSKTNQLEGFDVDIAKALANEILGDPEKVEFVVVRVPDRINFLINGKVDLIIAELSITKEREGLIDFSTIYYVAGQSILVKNTSPLYKLEDLDNKFIGVLTASTNLSRVEQLLPHSKFIHFNTIGSGFKSLDDDSIQAFSIDDVMLLGFKAHPQRFHKDYRFIGGEIALESYGIGVRKGCTEILKAINEALNQIRANGSWQKIYDANIGQISQISAHPPE